MGWSEWKKFSGGEPTVLMNKWIALNNSGSIVTDKDYSYVMLAMTGAGHVTYPAKCNYTCATGELVFDSGTQNGTESNFRPYTRMVILKDVKAGTEIKISISGTKDWGSGAHNYIVAY